MGITKGKFQDMKRLRDRSTNLRLSFNLSLHEIGQRWANHSSEQCDIFKAQEIS